VADRQPGDLEGPGREELNSARACLFGIVLGGLLWVLGVAVIGCAVAGCLR
jgi:hypothetical protein